MGFHFLFYDESQSDSFFQVSALCVENFNKDFTQACSLNKCLRLLSIGDMEIDTQKYNPIILDDQFFT